MTDTIESLRKQIETLTRERDEANRFLTSAESAVKMADLERCLATARGALEKVADERKEYAGNGDYHTLPALDDEEAQDLARTTLASLPHPAPSATEDGINIAGGVDLPIDLVRSTPSAVVTLAEFQKAMDAIDPDVRRGPIPAPKDDCAPSPANAAKEEFKPRRWVLKDQKQAVVPGGYWQTEPGDKIGFYVPDGTRWADSAWSLDRLEDQDLFIEVSPSPREPVGKVKCKTCGGGGTVTAGFFDTPLGQPPRELLCPTCAPSPANAAKEEGQSRRKELHNNEWVSIRADGPYVVLEWEYDGVKVELARELLSTQFSHAANIDIRKHKPFFPSPHEPVGKVTQEERGKCDCGKIEGGRHHALCPASGVPHSEKCSPPPVNDVEAAARTWLTTNYTDYEPSTYTVKRFAAFATHYAATVTAERDDARYLYESCKKECVDLRAQLAEREREIQRLTKLWDEALRAGESLRSRPVVTVEEIAQWGVEYVKVRQSQPELSAVVFYNNKAKECAQCSGGSGNEPKTSPSSSLASSPAGQEGASNNKMIYVGGSKESFRCDCRCNVFTEIGPLRYRCNSCQATFTGAPQ